MTRALLVTSYGAPEGVTVPVLAALEASELEVRAIDVGRAGARDEGTVGKFVRAIAGEFAERRVVRELEANPPDVVVAFDPASVEALTAWRDSASRPAPVVAVVAELAPGVGWAGTRADRYLAVDDAACVALSDKGIPGESILAVGPVAPCVFANAGGQSREQLRKRYKLSGNVVVVDVDGFGYDRTSQIALQLSLVGQPATYLFDAGADTEAATALRRQVPTLDLKAKLFGTTSDAPLLWRCADVAIVEPTGPRVARALAVGARVVSFIGDGGSDTNASALAGRGFGRTATSPLLLSSALEPLLAERGGPQPGDGAGNIAAVATVVGNEREAIIGETRSAAYEPIRSRVEDAAAWAEATTAQARAPGELEDLSGGAGVGPDIPPVDDAELAELKHEIEERITQTNKVVMASREAADKWEKRRVMAEKKGSNELAKQAAQNAESERARMHSALAELAQLSSELEALGKAESAPRPKSQSSSSSDGSQWRRGGGTSTRAPKKPGVDELLDEMKKQAGAPGEKKTSSRGKKKRAAPRSKVDDELAALKRKMAQKGKKT